MAVSPHHDRYRMRIMKGATRRVEGHGIIFRKTNNLLVYYK